MTRVPQLTYLLLLETPLWQFDFVRKEVASAEGMTESELAPEGLQTMTGLSISAASGPGRNFDDKVVVRITGKAVSSSAWLVTVYGVGEAQLTPRTRIPRPHFGSRPR